MKKREKELRSIYIPLTSTTTLTKLKTYFEQFYKSKRKNVMIPVNALKNVFIIDDVHLE